MLAAEDNNNDVDKYKKTAAATRLKERLQVKKNDREEYEALLTDSDNESVSDDYDDDNDGGGNIKIEIERVSTPKSIKSNPKDGALPSQIVKKKKKKKKKINGRRKTTIRKKKSNVIKKMTFLMYTEFRFKIKSQ